MKKKASRGGAPANYTDLVETENIQWIAKNSFPHYAKNNKIVLFVANFKS